MRIPEAIGGGVQIVSEHSGQFPCFRITGAEGQIVVLIPHPDGSVLGKPRKFRVVQENIRAVGVDVFLGKLLAVIAVIILDPAQRCVQFLQQAAPILFDREEEIQIRF